MGLSFWKCLKWFRRVWLLNQRRVLQAIEERPKRQKERPNPLDSVEPDREIKIADEKWRQINYIDKRILLVLLNLLWKKRRENPIHGHRSFRTSRESSGSKRRFRTSIGQKDYEVTTLVKFLHHRAIWARVSTTFNSDVYTARCTARRAYNRAKLTIQSPATQWAVIGFKARWK